MGPSNVTASSYRNATAAPSSAPSTPVVLATPTQFTDGQPYSHPIPENYAPGSIWLKEWEKIPNDKFTYNLIKNFAKEGKTENGMPSGKFFLDKAAAKTVTTPYVQKYMHKDDKDG